MFKTTFCKYWTSIKVEISMTSACICLRLKNETAKMNKAINELCIGWLHEKLLFSVQYKFGEGGVSWRILSDRGMNKFLANGESLLSRVFLELGILWFIIYQQMITNGTSMKNHWCAGQEFCRIPHWEKCSGKFIYRGTFYRRKYFSQIAELLSLFSDLFFPL